LRPRTRREHPGFMSGAAPGISAAPPLGCPVRERPRALTLEPPGRARFKKPREYPSRAREVPSTRFRGDGRKFGRAAVRSPKCRYRGQKWASMGRPADSSRGTASRPADDGEPADQAAKSLPRLPRGCPGHFRPADLETASVQKCPVFFESNAIGAERFELSTSWSQTKRASQTALRPAVVAV
jgi:hypothetical protein